MRLVLSQKGWCKMSDANQRIKALQEKLRPLGDELETRQAELEELSKTAYQDFQNAEEAERTCFSTLLELKKQNQNSLQERLIEQLDYEQRSDQIEDEISRLTRRLKFIDSTIDYENRHDFGKTNALKSERETLEKKLEELKEEKINIDAGHQREMTKSRISPLCELSKKHLDLINATNVASEKFQELHNEVEAVRNTFKAIATAYAELNKCLN